ncbi:MULTISPECIES: excinuclease ABC subunit A [Azospirillum]|uniref:Excinuclease ABC subunit A n=2 Tax=Azospirillum brasilense TaxID=192 RepID=A0ABU4PAN8_AZOBR|nr:MULTISPECIES: excinuclease ABC subunit A [Azospirillum]MDW7552349.1 excinuclease ABC subunit A [Azospirillum brasilense]MDW7592461.1 excinuclease ABC subunit A [Azospirillum brasilense]MDW7596489.1 excinuclease ABC subunit A [Azospirillum brasilense]MDW7627590.1 excinuclease ABC subunit A [Azospirillum brasilense]MDW7628844.1 excinuclease ABC subunit A [Azospirillum brasilense]
MNHTAALTLTVMIVTANFPALARDERLMFPVEAALSTAAAQGKLDRGVRLYFGDQKHPKTVANLGEWATNKKTNAFNKSDREACEWVFLSAVLELQERARKQGGDAVINIKSNYKNTETVSSTEYMCGAGSIMAGVALKGTVVKLGAK